MRTIARNNMDEEQDTKGWEITNSILLLLAGDIHAFTIYIIRNGTILINWKLNTFIHYYFFEHIFSVRACRDHHYQSTSKRINWRDSIVRTYFFPHSRIRRFWSAWVCVCDDDSFVLAPHSRKQNVNYAIEDVTGWRLPVISYWRLMLLSVSLRVCRAPPFQKYNDAEHFFLTTRMLTRIAHDTRIEWRESNRARARIHIEFRLVMCVHLNWFYILFLLIFVRFNSFFFNFVFHFIIILRRRPCFSGWLVC